MEKKLCKKTGCKLIKTTQPVAESDDKIFIEEKYRLLRLVKKFRIDTYQEINEIKYRYTDREQHQSDGFVPVPLCYPAGYTLLLF